MGCGPTFEPGFFRLGDMNVRGRQPKKIPGFKPIPNDDGKLREAMREVDFMVYGPKCKNGFPYPGSEFTRAATRGSEQIWIRKRRANAEH